MAIDRRRRRLGRARALPSPRRLAAVLAAAAASAVVPAPTVAEAPAPWTAPVDPASPEASTRCAAASYMMVALMAEAPPEQLARTVQTRDAFMLAAVDADAGRVVDAPLDEMPRHVAEAIRDDGARYLATLETRGGEDGDFGRFLLDDMDLCIAYLQALTERLTPR